MQAIVSGRLLPRALVTDMTTPERASYCLGIATYLFTCRRFLGHEGGVNGTASIAVVSLDGSDGAVIALNLRTGGDPNLPALAGRMLCDGRLRPTRRVTTPRAAHSRRTVQTARDATAIVHGRAKETR